MKIGVISDTHGYLDPRVAELFDGVEHILHAGDIGSPAILNGLEAIAPVTAVSGNNDYNPDWRERELVELAGRKFLVQHIVDPRAPAEAWAGLLDRAAVDVVVFGHTHRPHAEWRDGRLFFNPGYAGKPRFTLERSVAVIETGQGGLRHTFLPLSPR
jgi:putative phosphoesterase